MLGASSGASALKITAGAQLGAASYSLGGTEHTRIWARRSDGHLVTLRIDYGTPEWAGWVDRMPFGTPSPVAAFGVDRVAVDAVAFVHSSGSKYEYASYVASNGQLFVWRLVDGVPLGGVEFINIPAPAGQTLTGRVAIARYGDNPIIFFTTTSGRLYCYEITVYSPPTLINAHAPTFPVTGLAATMIDAVGTSGGVRVVFSKTDNRVYHYGRNVFGWQTNNFPGPGPVGSQAPCSLVATAEGNIGGTAGYRKYIFCTRTGTVNNAATTLYYQWTGTGVDFPGGGWSARSTSDAGGGLVATSGFGLTARDRGEDGNRTIEAFLLSPGSSVFHTEHRANQVSLGLMENLDTDGESTSRPGGIAAGGPDVRTHSDVFWVGAADSASWLYRKTSDGLSIFGQQLSQHGAGEGWKTYLANNTGTESSAAYWRGRVAVAAMYGDTASGVPGTWNPWVIKVLWSLDEGENWQLGFPVQIPNPAAPGFVANPSGGNWPWMVDPVIDFSDDGTAHIIAMARGKNGAGNSIGAIYYWATTNGTTFSAPICLEGCAAPLNLDHPWLSVDRSGVDVIHVVWGSNAVGALRYVNAPFNQPAQLAVQGNIQTIGAGGSIPRLTVSQWDGTVYVVWPDGICRNPVAGVCQGELAFGAAFRPHTAMDDPNDPNDSELRFSGTSRTLRSIAVFSAVVSDNDPRLVHFAYQQRESIAPVNGPPFDIKYAQFLYDSDDDSIDPSGPWVISSGEDAHIQSFPEITKSNDGPGDPWDDTLFVTWYDWGLGLTCQPPNEAVLADRCFRVRGRRNIESGNPWTWDPVDPAAFPTVSDPRLFPFPAQFCNWQGGVCQGDPLWNRRFAGDYHAVTGSSLHSLHMNVLAPVGGPDQTGVSLVRGWVSHGYANP